MPVHSTLLVAHPLSRNTALFLSINMVYINVIAVRDVVALVCAAAEYSHSNALAAFYYTTLEILYMLQGLPNYIRNFFFFFFFLINAYKKDRPFYSVNLTI